MSTAGQCATPSSDPLDQETLFFLVGSTAAGKSDLAPELARRAGAEILSMDSMLVYRGMDVGTAKPGPELRARARHHLLDLVEVSDSFSVQQYQAQAHAALEDCRRRGVRALFVGGTALYLKALTHGLFDGPPVDRELRARLDRRAREEGGAVLHAELRAVDPAGAERIHANDRKRLVRALEVFHQTGRPLSDWQRQWWRDGSESGGRQRRVVGLGIEAGELERRIPRRTRSLLGAGWVEEARALRCDPGFGPTSGAALGYGDVLRLADGEIGREECEARVNLRTRQFARRQRTWFRRFPEIEWITPSKDPAGSADGVLRALDW
jgi:tRNA dimethylallyltransferase